MPHAPTHGELFVLEFDLPTNTRPWFSAGAYVYNGFEWVRLDHRRERQAAPIGAQKVEIEERIDVTQLPVAGTGLKLAAVGLTPSTRHGGISGMASFTVEHEKNCHALTTVFRNNRPIGFVVSTLEAMKSQHITVTFADYPNSKEPAVYTLELTVGAAGHINVNQTDSHTYDGYSQTAFIVEENT